MRTLRTICLGLCTALLLTIGLAAPAHASISQCQDHELCTFSEINWGGTNGNHYDYSGILGCRNIGAGWNDNIGSGVNNLSGRVVMWTNANCGGRALYVEGHTAWTSGGTFDWTNNSFSSIAFTTKT